MTLQSNQARDRAEIEGLFARLVAAHAAKDAGAIAEAYQPDAVIYDLAPPLGRRGLKPDEIAAWLATWEGPIEIEMADAALTVAGDLAVSTAFTRMRGRQGGAAQDIWFRMTMCLTRRQGGWRILHEHSSVPFYMDGSDRAALDLAPPA